MPIQEFLTVSELNSLIRDVVTSGFPTPVWVCGEIQGYDRNKDKKHIFFELCEKDPASHEIIARIQLVIFSGKKAFLEEILAKAENAFSLKDDIEVKFLCQVDFYPPHGAVRLSVESIDPIYTLGKIAQGRQKLIAFLKEKGILDQNKQIPLALVPLKVGLITAYDSAAFNDFISELKKSGFGFRVFFVNSIMQGKNTEKSVCQALEVLSRLEDLDTIVITRGGGSIAELSSFDSRSIAEKIAVSRYPVLSGIGHEINVTVTDMAAHTYEKTPTAIARFLISRTEAFLMNLEEQWQTMIRHVNSTIEEERERLRSLAFHLQNNTTTFVKGHHEEMVRFIEFIKRHPLHRLEGAKIQALTQKALLGKFVRLRLHSDQTRLEHYRRVIEVAHPKNTLKRGFTITRTQGGQLLRSITQVKEDDPITTEVADGHINSLVHFAPTALFSFASTKQNGRGSLKGAQHGGNEIYESNKKTRGHHRQNRE